MAYPEDYPDDLTKAKAQGYLHKHMIVLVDPATGLPLPYNAISRSHTVLVPNGAATAPHTGTIVETPLVVAPVAANSMGPNGVLRVSFTLSVVGTTAKQVRTRFGGTGITGTILQQVPITTTLGYRIFFDICNRNSISSQIGSGSSANGTGNLGSLPLFSTINTTLPQNVVVSCELGAAGESMTIESFMLELIKP